MSINGIDRQNLADLWHELSQVTREEIFGAEDEKRRPLRNSAHATLPALGWVGKDYRPGDMVILAANPGGGGDAYSPAAGDRDLYASFERLKLAPIDAEILLAFEAMNSLYRTLTVGHNISLPVQAILRHGRVTSDQCSFLNVLPFRTRQDVWPGTAVRAEAVRRVAKPQLQALRPNVLVCLGMKACKEADRHLTDLGAAIIRIPRRIGDRSLHPDALPELARLQAMI